MLLTIIIFLVLLSVLVLVHEWGHFVTARLFGCNVEEFGLGFPPRAKKWVSQKTGINYSLNWLPIGGFVKIKGEDGGHKTDPDSFSAKPAWQRVIILSAGVAMNMLLAALLFTVGFISGLPTDVSAVADHQRAIIRDVEVQILEVLPDSPAQTAGLTAGDVITAIDSQSIDEVDDVSALVSQRDGQSTTMTITRDNQPLALTVTPAFHEAVGGVGIGVGLAATGIVSYPWYEAPLRGVQATGELTSMIIMAFADLIGRLVTGSEVSADITGPVGIAVLTGRFARLGLIYLLQFAALLSINLAIINFLPFPALDGGRVLFVAIEKIIRRPVNQRLESIVHNIGFALLLVLIFFVTYRDIAHFGGGLWQKIVG